MADTERTKAELLTIFATGQDPGSIDPQDMRDYVTTTANVNTRFTTGLIEGGIVTVNADDTKVDIAAGTGTFVDNFADPLNPLIIKASWSTFLGVDALNIATEDVTFFGLDLSTIGVVTVVKRSQEFTAAERRDFVILAPAIHPISVITSIGAVYSYVLDERHSLVDLADAIGQININGGNVYSSSSLLTLDKTAGSTFFLGVNYQNSRKTPNTTTDPAEAPVGGFIYTFRDGGGGFLNGPPVTSVDPANYDNNSGAPFEVPNNQFTIQRGSFFALINFTILQYGQNLYSTIEDAKAAINTEIFAKNPNIPTGFRFWLIVREDVTDLPAAIAETSPKAAFISAGKFGDVLRD